MKKLSISLKCKALPNEIKYLIILKVNDSSDYYYDNEYVIAKVSLHYKDLSFEKK